MRRFDSELSVAIEDLHCRTIIDSCDFQPARITKGGSIGVLNFGHIYAKQDIITLIERNRSYDFA